MSTSNPISEEQAKLWNGSAGTAWVASQDLLDRVFKPIELRLIEEIPSSATRVLDIGCGTGTTTLAASKRLGSSGRAFGIDVSEPMLTWARTRAEREGSRATFILADAQTHDFEPASFDAFISRFGVMFFGDPVAAFANLRSAAKRAAPLRMVAWRAASENPFMTTAERAAAPLLPDMPARKPDGPGQFAFADAERVRDILDRGGWSAIALQPLDVTCRFPEVELLDYVTRLGPLGLVLQQLDEQTRARVVDVVRAAFEPFVDGAEVRFDAACWMICAQA